MTLPLAFYLTAATAVLLTGFSKSGFGGGLGIMAVPLMSLFIDPLLAVAVMMPLLLAMDVLVAWTYRREWSGRVVGALLPGALVGLAIGAVTFQWMSAEIIKAAIGVIALVFVGLYVRARWTRQAQASGGRTNRGVLFALGGASGFASFVAHAGGPPVKGYLLRQGFDKTVFVGTNTMYFFTLNLIKTGSYAGLGQFSANSLMISLALSPVLVIGVWLGTRMHRLIDQTVFTGVVYGVLAVTGLKLLWDSLPVLIGGGGGF